MHIYSYLALGDSYTIGESVPLLQNFPYQTAQLLRQSGFPISAPEIMAKTGWTTGELLAAIDRYRFLSDYSFVSLLIGVNNQYRGLSIKEYEIEFEKLLVRSITLTGGEPRYTFVLSIPDYGKTPFGQKMDARKIEWEIDEFNHVNKKISDQYGTQYIDITMDGREAEVNPELVAEDGLHPSGKEYAKWADKLKKMILEVCNL